MHLTSETVYGRNTSLWVQQGSGKTFPRQESVLSHFHRRCLPYYSPTQTRALMQPSSGVNMWCKRGQRKPYAGDLVFSPSVILVVCHTSSNTSLHIPVPISALQCHFSNLHHFHPQYPLIFSSPSPSFLSPRFSRRWLCCCFCRTCYFSRLLCLAYGLWFV